jgi:predicted transcriptional regulator
MSKSAVVTARVQESVAADLDLLSRKMDRTRAWIAAKAIERYVRDELDLRTSLQQAEEEIDRGDYHSQQDMLEWAESLGRADAA